MSDLNMLAVTGGKERSAIEWKSLLVSTEQLVSLRGAVADRQQGKVRELTEHELAALAVYGSALDLECTQAGFGSIAEFERSSGRSH